MYVDPSVLPLDQKGNIKLSPSAYRPNKKALARIAQVHRDAEQGHGILNRSYTEFNDRSVIEEMNENQKSFNSYVPPRSDDPDEDWRAQTVRPIVRNKLISIAAHVLAELLYPAAFAQDDKSEEDRAASGVMSDLLEWVIENSNYKRSFVQAVIGMLVNPATILEQGFAEVMRTVKDMQEDGTYTQKEILDEVMSGFFTNFIPPHELLIANIYEPNIQKQRFLIRHKLVDYEEAKIVHGTKPNFKYVTAGTTVAFVEKENTFYNFQDPALDGHLVVEDTYYNRYLDLELTFVGGVLLCDPEYPIQRKDKRYKFAKGGYEPVGDGQFFYYKSAAAKMGHDEDLINTLYNMIMDGTFLALMPPMALYGDEEVGASVMVPGTVTSFRADTKLDSLAPRSDLRAGLEAISLVEKSIAESSADDSRQGIADSGGVKTAYEISVLDQNARISLGLFGKFISFLVEDIGTLVVGDILQNMTIAEISEISSASDPLRYKTFLLPDKVMDGRKVTKKIRFSDKMLGSEEMSEEESTSSQYRLLDEEGGLQSDVRIFEVNPDLFRKLKYKVSISTEKITSHNKALEKALNLELYDRAIQNPLADQDAVTREFLFETYKPGESDKYMKKEQPEAMGTSAMPAAEAEAPVVPTPGGSELLKGVNQNLTGQLTGSNSLGNAQLQG